MKFAVRLSLFGLLLLTLSQCKQPSVVVPQSNLPTRDDKMTLVNLNGAIAATSSPSAYFINRSTYALS
jgi:hypothetical protein